MADARGGSRACIEKLAIQVTGIALALSESGDPLSERARQSRETSAALASRGGKTPSRDWGDLPPGDALTGASRLARARRRQSQALAAQQCEEGLRLAQGLENGSRWSPSSSKSPRSDRSLQRANIPRRRRGALCGKPPRSVRKLVARRRVRLLPYGGLAPLGQQPYTVIAVEQPASLAGAVGCSR